MADFARKIQVRQIPGPECTACLGRLVRATLDGCASGGELPGGLLEAMDRIVADGLANQETPAVIATRFLALARQRSGVDDPFEAKKEHDFATAAQAAQALGDLPDTLEARVKAAILGNAFDHFFVADQQSIWGRGLGLELAVNDLAEAEKHLSPGALVAILADNCGEQSFDRLLVEHLERRGCRVAYVVKSGPAQNDLCLDDLRRTGQGHGLGMVVGSSTEQVGLDPSDTPDELARFLDACDLVIAKGMGHFETMGPQAGLWPGGRVRWPVLMLFLAKCAPVAGSLSLEKGSGVARFIQPG